MRLVAPMAVLLLAPVLLLAQTVPADYFPGIHFEEPLATAFATGQGLPLVGQIDDASVEVVLFKFIASGGERAWDFVAPVKNGRFARDIVFVHEAAGLYDLAVFAGGQGASIPQVGFFEGIQISQGQGPVFLPRRFFPGLVFDRPLPTLLATGQALDLAGVVEDLGVGQIVVSLHNSTRSAGDFFLFVEAGRFQRSIVLSHDAEGTYALALFAGKRGENLPFVGDWAPFEVGRGSGPIELPPLFFDGLALDQPLPVEWPVERPVTWAGTVQPFVRDFWLRLQADGGAERLLLPGLEGRRFNFPVRLEAGELGPVRLAVFVERADGTVWEAGAFTVMGTDPPAGDLQVGVVALALLAGGSGQVPLYNRGTGRLTLEEPLVEGPFSAVAFAKVLEPGQAGAVELVYSGTGGDQGLLTLRSDDPLRPRVAIALSGVESPQAAVELAHLRADAQGLLQADFDLATEDRVLALYTAAVAPDPQTGYEIRLDGSGPLAKAAPVPAPQRRDQIDSRLRQREGELARKLQQSGWRAPKPAMVQYEVGDRRSFVFSGAPGVPAQELSARVVALNERAVAFVQENLRERDDNVDEGQMQRAIDMFAGDYELLVATFGAPSDVDGDGKIAALFTYLIDDIGGVAGQFRSDSVVPQSQGGDGNMTDLLYLNPALPSQVYRAVLAHEFQHLISFNQHALVRLGQPEEEWLNEGLSHVAEDLVAQVQDSGNYALVRAFLAAPGAVGLSGPVDRAKRGAAYLFVRSLVDLLGREVLLRLVQTDLVDRDNIEAATGESMADLLARWGAQLYLSGTPLSQHPRFNFRLEPLQTPQGRGFPPPAWISYAVGGEPPALPLPSRGLQFLRLTGAGQAQLAMQIDPGAAWGAVALPLARGALGPMAADHFAGLTLDPPPPVQLATGQALLVQGTTADSVAAITLEFVPEDGGRIQRFFVLVSGGHFAREIYFDHDEAGTYALNVFVDQRRPTPFVGGFFPIRLSRGSGPVQAPVGYFNRVLLDRPLPTALAQGENLAISGAVADPGATRISFILALLPPAGADQAPVASHTLSLPVEGGRFAGELALADFPSGRYQLAVEVGPAGDLTCVGAVDPFEILPPMTAVVEGATPPAFALYANYPNPFNSRTLLSFALPDYQAAVELALYDLLGQKLAVLARGPWPAGVHTVAWDGRDGRGRALASGSYLYRLQAGPHRRVGKLLLLR